MFTGDVRGHQHEPSKLNPLQALAEGTGILHAAVAQAHAHFSQQVDQRLRPLAEALSQHIQRSGAAHLPARRQRQPQDNRSLVQPPWMPVLAVGEISAGLDVGKLSSLPASEAHCMQLHAQPCDCFAVQSMGMSFAHGGHSLMQPDASPPPSQLPCSSLTSSSSARGTNSLFHLAMAKDEVKAVCGNHGLQA